jgi:hypothetical protein
MNQPRPAMGIIILSADVLVAAAQNLVDKLAFAGSWEPGIRLRDAIAAYSAVRLHGVLQDEADPQKMNGYENAPDTQRSGART